MQSKRGQGYRAKDAVRAMAFLERHGDRLRVRFDADEDCDLSWLDAPEYPAKARAEVYRMVDRDGCWGATVEVLRGQRWHHVDSLWGLIGNPTIGDALPFEYFVDMIARAKEAIRESEREEALDALLAPARGVQQ